jgi:putative membrane protein
MMWYSGSGVEWWGWLLMSLGMVAFWGVVIWTVWYFVAGVTRSTHKAVRPADGKAILDERLARGEIDDDEYRRLRDLIRGDEVRASDRQTPVAVGGRR